MVIVWFLITIDGSSKHPSTRHNITNTTNTVALFYNNQAAGRKHHKTQNENHVQMTRTDHREKKNFNEINLIRLKYLILPKRRSEKRTSWHWYKKNDNTCNLKQIMPANNTTPSRSLRAWLKCIQHLYRNPNISFQLFFVYGIGSRL